MYFFTKADFSETNIVKLYKTYVHKHKTMYFLISIMFEFLFLNQRSKVLIRSC